MMRSTFACALSAGMAVSVGAQDYRSINGTGNNLSNHNLGSAGTLLLREASGAMYQDGLGSMMPRPSARTISNALGTQTAPLGNGRDLSSMFWQWGQFIDHDFALVGTNAADPANIAVPAGDPWFDPMNTGTATIHFNRSLCIDGVNSPRQHANEITHFLDGSMVYGSNETRATTLREHSGGRLLMTSDGFMPRNTFGLPNANDTGAPDESLFLGGDVRANEQVGLTAMHTLFVREHNRWADTLGAQNPGWDDERIYQTARKIVGAEIQKITYEDWLPSMMGGKIDAYAGYDSNVDPSMSSAFTTAAYRFGHTMLNEQMLLIGPQGQDNGSYNLFESFFNPDLVTPDGVMEDLMRGLAWQEANEVDTQVIDDVRNMLFGPPGSGGLDLLSLNLQRGRDHGVADYNTMREDFGLERVDSFDDITSDTSLAAAIAQAYDNDIDSVDAWIGLMAEDHAPGAAIGETLMAIFADQFARMRDGDRFFYLNDADLLPWLSEIESTSLADIIAYNTDAMLAGNVFVVPAPASMALVGLAGLGVARRKRA
ncbi:MAG: peroxiredoxin [Phycisphaera sp.]|nr:MAG: peroxiredoxin [Phycisphaera sp.]